MKTYKTILLNLGIGILIGIMILSYANTRSVRYLIAIPFLIIYWYFLNKKPKGAKKKSGIAPSGKER